MNIESNTAQQRYSQVAMWLHWIIAILIIANWQMVERTEHASEEVGRLFFGIHMANGILILALSLARLGWRLTHRPPAAPATHKPWERVLAGVTHWAFYLFMIAMPLSGWVAKSTGKFFDKPVDMWGIFSIPALPLGQVEWLHEAAEAIHHNGLLLLQLLLVLHIGGALKHWLIDKDGTFRRMWFGRAA